MRSSTASVCSMYGAKCASVSLAYTPSACVAAAFSSSTPATELKSIFTNWKSHLFHLSHQMKGMDLFVATIPSQDRNSDSLDIQYIAINDSISLAAKHCPRTGIDATLRMQQLLCKVSKCHLKCHPNLGAERELAGRINSYAFCLTRRLDWALYHRYGQSFLTLAERNPQCGKWCYKTSFACISKRAQGSQGKWPRLF